MHSLVQRASQAIIALFGLAGGFVTKIAPPPHWESTGFATIILIIVFVIVAAFKKERKQKIQRRWIPLAVWSGAMGAFLGFCFIFARKWYVFSYPHESDHQLVRGLWMTPKAANYSAMDPALLLEEYGGEQHFSDIWSPVTAPLLPPA